MRRTAALLCFCLSVAAHAESWHYQAYPDRTNILHAPEKPLAPGHIVLDESGDHPIFQMFAGTVTTCFSGPIDAKVKKTAEHIFITVRRDLRGCFPVRFVIRKDGTGGRREVMRNGRWVSDGLEHGLTIKQ